MRLRRPPPPGVGLFHRGAQRWRELGYDSDTFPGAPSTPVEAMRALLENSALTPNEVAVLRSVAAGRPDPRLPIDADLAARALRRWDGPIEGLKLKPLDHWEDSR